MPPRAEIADGAGTGWQMLVREIDLTTGLYLSGLFLLLHIGVSDASDVPQLGDMKCVSDILLVPRTNIPDRTSKHRQRGRRL